MIVMVENIPIDPVLSAGWSVSRPSSKQDIATVATKHMIKLAYNSGREFLKYKKYAQKKE